MKSNRFLRYAAIASLLACAACKPTFFPGIPGDNIHVDLSGRAAPAAVDAAKAAVAGVQAAR
ncbi:hypothetical protein ABIE09_001043 [Lysobacter enzymogenes]|jgi:hypothetical protein|uniref:hypothetical protein n=1 Tax=Lysobacter enzymogenes TaxID=69 RepID=UPI000895C63B|nr:hypothetical protein [Lysobacter enzymogenes]SDX61824.1 hypothetical protein SAMN05421681_106294 [Lysobacter enzymogenes]